MPLHLRARAFTQLGLFTSLTNFAELERRISNLSTDKAKGDAFEVFAEAYLTTQRKHDAEKVWPFSAVELSLLKELGLLEKDYGVDGLFRTHLGTLSAYQVKFRTNRPVSDLARVIDFHGIGGQPANPQPSSIHELL